jgi:hypothetical protein
LLWIFFDDLLCGSLRWGVREARVQDIDRGRGAAALRRGRRRSHKAQRVTRVVFG